MIKYQLVAIAALCCCGSGAFALDGSELSSLTNTVREMCVHPDRVGDYLKTEGEVKVGAPVLIKIINADLSGKIDYEKWRGISITADKYKTDPRQCSIEILKILMPELHSGRQGNVTQSTDGPCSPAIANVGGNVTVKGDCK
ncbi:hypothetical protein S58_61690 [Bradyrhizobium oligotrophicum S58]|uniref:Uncharacterized protein n=1 Tax=Bradyrhizobium oligotrophicum S58 TaxID=1245469 RepID=M4ZEB7_9BRAD|nr:hypothetical protein [Bradyrhizobium oligotrophicum]BAM92143.1 hypothetical protein S58_61690 [Bradyrhizobium oligotrophicum S58]